MADTLVYLPLTNGELRALVCYLADGGVIGRPQELELYSAVRKLRAWTVDG